MKNTKPTKKRLEKLLKINGYGPTYNSNYATTEIKRTP